MFISTCDRLQLRTDDSTACHGIRNSHNVNGRMCVWRAVEARGQYEEGERETLAGEDKKQQVRPHCPVVIDEASAFFTFARGLLPRHTRLVDQKSKQNWSWYHTYKDINTTVQ